MQILNRQLAANGGQNVAVRGNYIWMKSSTGRVQIKTDRGEVDVLEAGDFATFDKEFSEFYILDLSGAQNDLTLKVSNGGDAGKYGNITVKNPTLYKDIADITLTAATTEIILAANSVRGEAVITADTGNANVARIGGSTAGAARGTPLPAGATLILTTSAVIYGYSLTAPKFQVSYTEY